jgi:hypothetical protein
VAKDCTVDWVPHGGYLQQDVNASAFSLVFLSCHQQFVSFLPVYVMVNLSLNAKRFQIGVIPGSRQKYLRKILISQDFILRKKKRDGK